jgi:hypothetical protein
MDRKPVKWYKINNNNNNNNNKYSMLMGARIAQSV